MGLVIRKHDFFLFFLHANNKGADQPAHRSDLISALFHCSLLSITAKLDEQVLASIFSLECWSESNAQVTRSRITSLVLLRIKSYG